MKLDQQKFPAIAPVPAGIHRPLWSVMIPTYNCTKYLERTLKSVLEQAPSPELMQIEVVDNCSTQDDPEALVNYIGKGRVSFYRQPQNIGAVRNFNTCMERSRGHIVHILHSDDLVLPGFYQVLQAAFEQEPTIGAAFCHYIYIDETERQQELPPFERTTAGIFPDLIERIAVSSITQAPAIVVKRSVYEAIGGFHLELFHAGDWELYKRIAAFYPVWYEPQVLACYRRHNTSTTSKMIRSGANIAELRQAIEISQQYLPEPLVAELTAKSREFFALYAFRLACWLLVVPDFKAAMAQTREAFKCSYSPKVISQMLLFLTGFLLEGGTRRGKRALLKVRELLHLKDAAVKT